VSALDRSAPARGLVSAALVVLVAGAAAVPGWAAEIRYGSRAAGVTLSPVVDRQGHAQAARVGLESTLSVRTEAAGRVLTAQAGHEGSAWSTGGALALDQRTAASIAVGDLVTVPAYGLSLDLQAEYAIDQPRRWRAGRSVTTLTLDAAPLDTLSTRAEVAWSARGLGLDRAGSGRARAGIGFDIAVPAWKARIGLSENVVVSRGPGRARRFRTGLDLDFGPHSLSLTRELSAAGAGPADPPRAGAAYGWQVGPLGLAVAGDYTQAQGTRPSHGFAGLAIRLGHAGPGPGAFLDGLR
jgi:hypothetical protein